LYGFRSCIVAVVEEGTTVTCLVPLEPGRRANYVTYFLHVKWRSFAGREFVKERPGLGS
jgi:hypothetical protein